eukprot:gnl/TRDRNA2_/TRDRNA2_34460_c0_seq1.p1 gnl/TRDRNA2_/TRDRNA2_34460_c0~~gnl/TRDRNA2_/TRDRNA2_34460_c0_seq1.p1  ORF type:complete len:518 (+),score=71.77 gnl/TRDRNA2_/TRDRNA2_34460_c0_seq1:39-1592(+)
MGAAGSGIECCNAGDQKEDGDESKDKPVAKSNFFEWKALLSDAPESKDKSAADAKDKADGNLVKRQSTATEHFRAMGRQVTESAQHKFSVCCGSMKLDGMTMSEAAVNVIAQHLTSVDADVIAWLETDTRLDDQASWRRLAKEFEKAGYLCWKGGGATAPDGSSTPAVEMSEGRYTALLIAIRESFTANCSVTDSIERCDEPGGAKAEKGSAKGFLQRALHIYGAVVVIMACSLPPKPKKKMKQISKLAGKSLGEKVTLNWHDNPTKGHSRYTCICFGDFNMRIVSKEEWITDDNTFATEDGCCGKMLSDDAVEEITAMLSSEAGRRQLVKMGERNSRHNDNNWAENFYDQTSWWCEGHGSVPMPTYKRTPYYQAFPLLASEAKCNDIVTSLELLERAKRLTTATGDDSTEQAVRTLLKAEEHSFNGAEPTVLQRQFFGARDKIPASHIQKDAAQRYLNVDASNVKKLISMGWLDSVAFARERLSTFRHQSMRDYQVVPQIHGFDHLMSFGVMDFEP